jgi:hypothetical protein
MSTPGLPRHETNASILRAKRELHQEVARQYAVGCATEDELTEAAVDYVHALEVVAMANMRARR